MKKGRLNIIVLIFSLLYMGCGDLDSALNSTSSKAYKISALLPNSSLDETSVIAAGAEIRPFFITPPVGDKDLQALTIYALNDTGKIAGEKIVYRLAATVAAEAASVIADAAASATAAESIPAADGFISDNDLTDSGVLASGTAPSSTEPADGLSEAGSLFLIDDSAPPQETGAPIAALIDTSAAMTAGKPEAAENITPDSIPGSGDEKPQDIPLAGDDTGGAKTAEASSAGSAAGLASGSSDSSGSALFPETADGKAETGTVAAVTTEAADAVTEKAAVPAEKEVPPLPPPPPAVARVREIIIDNFAYELPSFTLSAVLTEGRYTLVFEITGAETVLSRTEKPFYYIARKTFTFNGIRSFVSSGEPNTTIVAPGEHILFEANLVCDKSFHPYIIWRDNNKEIAAGYLDADKYSLLWEAPAKNGFKNISAEIFPVKPRPEDIAMRGVTANISIAVSEKAKTGAFLAANMDNFNAWFRLAGSLKDEKNKSRALVSPEGTEVIWRGVSSTYGLLIDSRRNYALPDTTLKILKGSTAAEKLLFAVHPKSSGLFYSADIKDGNKPYYSVKLSVTADGFSLSVVPAYDAELAEKVFVPRNPAEPIHAVSFEYTLDEKGIVFTLENEGKTGTAAFDFVHLDAEKKKDARLPAVWPSAYSVKQRFGGALNGEQTASGILTELAIQSGTKTGEADVAANAKNGASSSSQ